MGWWFSSKKVTRLEREIENFVNEIELLKRKVEVLSRNAMMHSESILGKRHRGEDGEQATKRSKGSIETELSFEKYFENLHRNLNDLKTNTNKIKEENINLNNKLTIKEAEITKLTEQLHQTDRQMREIKSDFKQKENDCVYFRETCVTALGQLSRYQIQGFNFIEQEPQTYPVAFSNGIKNLVDEINENKKQNIDLLQYKTEREKEIISLQIQIGNLEQINSKFQNQNQQLQATLDQASIREELSNSYLQTQNEFNQLKRAANVNQEECDMLEEVLHLLSRITEYEEQLKTIDISAINTKLQELNKSLGKSYGKEIRRLNLDILKLLQILKDDQINKQHEVFKRAMNLKTEALEREQEHSYLLNQDLRKKFKNQIYENMRSIEDQLNTFQQIIFNFPAIEVQRRMIYEDIVSALTHEYIQLQNLSSIKHSSPKTESRVSFDLPENDIALENSYVRETLERLVKINKNTRELEKEVNKFRGSKADKIFLDLEHKLLGNIMSVDTIQVNGYEVIRENRREAIKYAQECMDKLNDNVINM